MLTAVSKDTLPHQAADTLKRYILTEDLPTGTQLPSERELSEMLAVSRNIIREALSSLVAHGVVEKIAGKGTFVCEFDRHAAYVSMPLTVSQANTTAQEVREARAALEIGAVGMIVSRITPSEIKNLESILQACEDKHSAGKSIYKDDIEFHLALLKATKNKVIEGMAPLVYDMFRRTFAEDPQAIRRDADRILIEHRQIINALHAADIVAARLAMHTHFRLQDFPV